MSPAVLIVGFCAFATALAAHVAFWRWAGPKNDIRAIFMLFFIVPGALAACYILAAGMNLAPQLMAADDAAVAFLLFAALSSAYVISYPAAQAVSPSLEMMIIIGKAMPQGLSRDQVFSHFKSIELISSRFRDLLDTNLVKNDNGLLVLSAPAKVMVSFFSLYRKLLGLSLKGG